MTSLRRLAAVSFFLIAFSIVFPVCAEEDAAATDQEAFPPEQIEQLVAPIALYPDALIAQMLMASTYPLDVVQANRWLGDHKGLEGDDLQQAVDAEAWDDSVKALVFFPSVLGFMSDNLDWTQDLGDAVLAQQAEVTNAIQHLRGQAEDAGNLASNDQQRVEQDGDTIIIQPAQPEVVYVPTYDPVKTYGASAPPAQSYYPDAYADASASYDAGYAAGKAAGDTTTTVVPVESSSSSSDSLVSFGVGALAGGLLTAAIMWNNNDSYNRIYSGGRGYYRAPSYWSQPNYWNNNGWRQPNNINVDRNVDRSRNVQRGDVTVNKGIVGSDISGNRVQKWEHDPSRRGGVRYRNASTEHRFAGKRTEGSISRDSARGRPVKAPRASEVKREGRVSGGLAKLDRGDGQRGSGALKNRTGDRQGNAPRPAGKGQGQARGKVQGKAPAARTKPKPRQSDAARRPVNKQAKRPDTPKAKARAKRPAQTSSHKAQRPARQTRSQGRAFQPKQSKSSRKASHRGASSRSRAGHGGGRARSGGGPRGRG